jgi:hypothetical protein
VLLQWREQCGSLQQTHNSRLRGSCQQAGNAMAVSGKRLWLHTTAVSTATQQTLHQ